MQFRKSLVAVLSVASLGAFALPATANAAVAVYFNSAPPAARYEVVPAPRAGYEWSAGYWNMRGNHHRWQKGHWERQRHGYHFTQPTWTERDNRWQLERGSWRRGDRDGDGVPNAVDRAPSNPNRN